VDENMANAARVHAVEWGKDIAGRAMIAFGGAAPLHAARLAEKVNIRQVIVPAGAGVGSAVGFLRAPISYEVVRSRYMRLDQFDADGANALLDGMRAEAEAIVRQGAPTGALNEVRFAFMRYVGQGHEITVELPARALTAADAGTLRQAFEETYRALYGQTVPGQEPEILTWTLTVSSAAVSSALAAEDATAAPAGQPIGTRRLFDSAAQAFVEAQVWRRESMGAAEVPGPALIVEDQTTTVVPDGFTASQGKGGALVLMRG
jgi:N-methylhydantoinase A